MSSQFTQLPLFEAGIPSSIPGGTPITGIGINDVLFVSNSGTLTGSTNLRYFTTTGVFLVSGDINTTTAVYTDDLFDHSTGTRSIDVSGDSLIDQGGGVALGWSNPGEIDISGLLFVGGQFFCDSTAIQSSGAGDLTARTVSTSVLYDPSNALAFDVVNRTLYDASEHFSIDLINRLLFDTSSVASVDYLNRGLRAAVSGATVLDWNVLLAYDTNATASLNWSARYAFDANGVFSMNWNDRQLIDQFGAVQLGWVSTGINIPGVLTVSNSLVVASGLTSLDAAKITTTGSGTFNKYNNQTVVANGVASIVASINLTAQAASIGTTTLVAGALNGHYLVTVYLVATTAGTSGTVSCTLGWTDAGAARTQATPTITFGTLAAPAILTQFMVTTASNITYSTTVTSAIGSPRYELGIDVVRHA